MAEYKDLDPILVMEHYKRPEILKAMLDASGSKEVVGSYGGKGYAKRPDILQYENDILDQIKGGVTSFHASEELWSDPLHINTDLSKDDLANLRIGWDLLLDIDCKDLEISKIAADLLVKALASYVDCVSVKFSGNHGFHIAVPFEAFPKTFNGKKTSLLFPEAPRKIAVFLKDTIEKKLIEELHAYGAEFNDPFDLVEIDTILLTSRHLYRQVYSLNEKSGLVSLPINPHKILLFDPKIASIEKGVFSRFTFLDRSIVKENEGLDLLIDAYDYKHDYAMKMEELEQKKREESAKEYEQITEKIPAFCFPPQIKKMFEPLQDGKKRAIFILGAFLKSCGYSMSEIEQQLFAWNDKHPQPLREAYLRGQLSHLSKQDEMLPPNFGQAYQDIIGDVTDSLSEKVKNPVAYAKLRFREFQLSQDREKKTKKKKTQQ